MSKSLPLKTSACASVAQLASQNEENIRELLRDKTVFLILDEAKVDQQKIHQYTSGQLGYPK